MPLRRNDRIDLQITGMTADGSGVGRHEGMAVFVPNAAVGDRITAHIVKVTKSVAYGRIHQVVTPSPDRIEADCPAFSPCGGCVYRHISYEAELRIKAQRVLDAMTRIGHVEAPCRMILDAKQTDGYRNKAQYPVGTGHHSSEELLIGFYAKHSHRIIDCRACQLQPPVFFDALDAFDRWIRDCRISCYDESTNQGLLRHIYLRQAQATGEIMACAVLNGDELPEEAYLVSNLIGRVPGLKSVMINVNRARTNVILGDECRLVWGQDHITDRLCGLKIRISPLSFYQVNHDQAERLYGLAAQYARLTGSQTVLDLYCGAGTIGLSMAGQCAQIVGVENVPAAVEDARLNAAQNGIGNARFLCDDAAGAADRLLKEGMRPDVVLLDPPRKGCDASLPPILTRLAPARIVYVSCDPATLARDCARFAAYGYQVEEYTPVDLFPRTAHVETIASLSISKQEYFTRGFYEGNRNDA